MRKATFPLLLTAACLAGCARSPESFRVGDLQPQDQRLLEKRIYLGQYTMVKHPMPYGVQDGNAVILYPDGEWRLEYSYSSATQTDPQRILSVDEYLAENAAKPAPASSAANAHPALDPDREVTRHEIIGLVKPYEPVPGGYVVVPVVKPDGSPAGEVLLERETVDPTAVRSLQ